MFNLKEFLGLGFYTSPLDEFLATLDQKESPSPSQEKEIKKYKRIFRLRDNPNAQDTKQTLWDHF